MQDNIRSKNVLKLSLSLALHRFVSISVKIISTANVLKVLNVLTILRCLKVLNIRIVLDFLQALGSRWHTRSRSRSSPTV